MAAIAHLPCSESRVPSSKKIQKIQKNKAPGPRSFIRFRVDYYIAPQEYGRE
jgi:hypothetical protein